MTPEFENMIAQYPELSEESVKLIFIRDRAKKAFIEDKIREATSETFKDIITLGTIASASKDDISIHIGNLERCRNYLSCLIQGLKIGYVEQEEPKIRAKREKEAKEKATSRPKTVEGILAKYGLNLDSLQSKLVSDPLPPPETKPLELTDSTCPKCGKGGIILMDRHVC